MASKTHGSPGLRRSSPDNMPIGLIQNWALHKQIAEADLDNHIHKVRQNAEAARLRQQTEPMPKPARKSRATVSDSLPTTIILPKPMSVTPGAITSTPEAMPEPARKRGRPPGSKNKPKLHLASITAPAPKQRRATGATREPLTDDANCCRCGYPMELSRHLKGLWTCLSCA